jgi:hypothetical protein
LDNQGDSTLLAWLLRTGFTQRDMQEIVTRLNDTDSLTRMFAVAAAARLGLHNSVPLEHAANSTDSEVSTLAKDELELLR